MLLNLLLLLLQIMLKWIFFDLVRQVNRRTPDKVEKKSKKKCVIL